jgi:hypothetical protein
MSFDSRLTNMTLFDTVKTFLSNNKGDVPEGYCPNCWGRQEYQGKFFEAVKREGIDTQNITEKKGWIQAYAEQHFSGIELAHSEPHNTCASCGMKYVDEE